MPTLYIDFETWWSAQVKLKKLTLRQYLSKTKVLGMAYAIDDGLVDYLTGSTLQDALADFHQIAVNPEWTVVAHNAAFDIRVWRLLLNLPQPQHVHCTLELACAAFPNQPGGYSLKALAGTLNLGMEKLEMPKNLDDEAAMAIYCKADTELCRRLHKLTTSRLHADEIRVAELANAARELWFEIDGEAAATAATTFQAIARQSVDEAAEILDSEDAFGFDGESVRSVKPQAMKKLLLENLGFETQSISFKKMNPEKLRANPDAATALKATERANKALSHQRRVRVFSGSQTVDVEMGYFRAHTGRFSSPQPGCRGINLHNLSKRDKAVAKALRSIFRLPDELCFVRADLSNVEYRIEGWLTDADHTLRVFGADLAADPYLEFGFAATGIRFTRTDPIRQVFKAAVLGLGYGMGVFRFMEELAKSLADPQFKVSLADLEEVCRRQSWTVPNIPQVKAAQTKARVPDAIAAVAYHMRELFHRVHPEFMRVAKWLEIAIDRLSRSLSPESTLDALYSLPSAPSREKVELLWAGEDYGPGTRSVRVRCGVWPAATVTWRDFGLRPVLFNGSPSLRMCAIQAGNKGYRPLSLTVLIENVVQSAARNALCRGQLQLQELGYNYQLSVHDEILLVVPKNPDAVLAAKRDLLRTFGPGNQLGWDWSVAINPAEINVSSSMYELELGSAWWDALPSEPQLLESLP